MRRVLLLLLLLGAASCSRDRRSAGGVTERWYSWEGPYEPSSQEWDYSSFNDCSSRSSRRR